MKDPFGTATGRKQEETAYAELPLGQWFVARTSDKGGAIPRIQETREGVAFMFKTGLYCVGGDGKKITPAMFGQYGFFEAFMRPNYKEQGGPQTQEEYDTLSGRLVGFITATLSAGIEDKEARWAHALNILATYASTLAEFGAPDEKLTPEMFDVEDRDGVRDNAEYMTRVFALYLKANPRLVMVNLAKRKIKGQDDEKILVGSFKEATEDNGKAMQMFSSKAGDEFALYGAPEDGADIAF